LFSPQEEKSLAVAFGADWEGYGCRVNPLAVGSRSGLHETGGDSASADDVAHAPCIRLAHPADLHVD
jgi:hypothetical protein